MSGGSRLRRRLAGLAAAAGIGAARRALRRGAGGPHARLPLMPEEPRAARRAELVVVFLLLMVVCAAFGFIAVYVVGADTQYLGLALGLAFTFLAVALVIAGKAMVPQEEEHEERSVLVHEEAQEEVAQLVEEGGSGIHRRGLLLGAAGAALAALGAALVVPVASLGPFLGAADRLSATPWRRGRRLVDESGEPIAAADIAVGTMVVAFAEGAPKDTVGSPLTVIRLRPDELRLPADRRDWAPEGIMAFSRICPHAACAVSMFRYPLFEPNTAGPALVCPCHYSTFDVTRGGTLVFGPAGRPLPQLPIVIDRRGHLRATSGFPEKVGPSWWGVRLS